MRRRWSAAVAVAMVAGSLGVAAPARAGTDDVCYVPPLPVGTLVEIEDNKIHVYPGNVPVFTSEAVAWAKAHVECGVKPLVGCVQTIVANRPTVTIDINTLAITIDYSALIGTACSV